MPRTTLSSKLAEPATRAAMQTAHAPPSKTEHVPHTPNQKKENNSLNLQVRTHKMHSLRTVPNVLLGNSRKRLARRRLIQFAAVSLVLQREAMWRKKETPHETMSSRSVQHAEMENGPIQHAHPPKMLHARHLQSQRKG